MTHSQACKIMSISWILIGLILYGINNFMSSSVAIDQYYLLVQGGVGWAVLSLRDWSEKK